MHAKKPITITATGDTMQLALKALSADLSAAFGSMGAAAAATSADMAGALASLKNIGPLDTGQLKAGNGYATAKHHGMVPSGVVHYDSLFTTQVNGQTITDKEFHAHAHRGITPIPPTRQRVPEPLPPGTRLITFDDE